MFLTKSDIQSSDYIELQYIKNDLKDSVLLNFDNIQHFKDDSLFVKGEDLDLFENKYGDIFSNTTTPDGSNKFYAFGINLYSVEQTKQIYMAIKQSKEDNILLQWIKEAIDKNYRIYILGL